MENIPIQVSTKMDVQTFTAFSHFNAFRFRRRGLGLALFPFGMAALGIINYLAGSPLLCWILTGMGLVLPLLYLLIYHRSLGRQIKAYDLEHPKNVYTVTLSGNGIHVENETQQTDLRWDQIFHVFLLENCAYLYVTKARVFLLPYRDIECGAVQDLETLLFQNLHTARLSDRRKNQ